MSNICSWITLQKKNPVKWKWSQQHSCHRNNITRHIRLFVILAFHSIMSEMQNHSENYVIYFKIYFINFVKIYENNSIENSIYFSCKLLGITNSLPSTFGLYHLPVGCKPNHRLRLYSYKRRECLRYAHGDVWGHRYRSVSVHGNDVVHWGSKCRLSDDLQRSWSLCWPDNYYEPVYGHLFRHSTDSDRRACVRQT